MYLLLIDSRWVVRIRILRKRVHSCIVGTQCAFILMRTVRIVKNNYLHHWSRKIICAYAASKSVLTISTLIRQLFYIYLNQNKLTMHFVLIIVPNFSDYLATHRLGFPDQIVTLFIERWRLAMLIAMRFRSQSLASLRPFTCFLTLADTRELSQYKSLLKLQESQKYR